MNKQTTFEKYLSGNDSFYSSIVNKNFNKIKLFRLIYIRLKIYFRRFYFFRFLQMINFSTGKYANKNTDLTIDGFQRSANTFAYVGFSILNNHTRVAHHAHTSSQIIYSVNNDIPVLLLIRNPIDSIVSFYIFLNGEVPFKVIINSWKHFYLPLIKFKDKIFVSDFNDTINDFEDTIKKINSFYNLNFKTNYYEKDLEKEIFKKIEQSHKNHFDNSSKNKIAIPYNDRLRSKSVLKQVVKKDFKKEIEECKLIYDKFKR